jgi:hypothetical protein
MAKITGSSDEKIFTLKEFLGLHQNPDGDTKLKFGEAAAMRNFRVTRDKNLQKRPGTRTLATLQDGEKVRGLWNGYVMGEEVMLAACGGHLYKLVPDDDLFNAVDLGAIDTSQDVHIFGFQNLAYIINGTEYKQYNGETLSDVDGYRPLVKIAVTADGEGSTLEQVNKLVGTRRCWISGDNENNTFPLPEQNIQSLDYVKDLTTNSLLEDAAYTYDLEAGTVTFTDTPPQAANSFEIGWTVAENFRTQVSSMRYSELYSGTQNSRVFLYGDGSNKAIYSDLDYDGNPRADYFPDMNEVKVGEENTPITGMIRHYSALICYKLDSAWSISYGLTTLANDIQTAAFYVTPINRIVGNAALGQVRLVLNSPYTLQGNDLYEWKNSSSYNSNLTVDERQAKRISDRVYATLRGYELDKCFCWDDNDSQEYYICYNKKALVYNYACDAWYSYENFDVCCMANRQGGLYIGSSDGKVKHLSYNYKSDDNDTIDAYWESGSMSFDKDFMRKYSAMMWIGMKPESSGEVYVTVQTDKKSVYAEKVVASSLISFKEADFSRWSFKVNRKPFMTRLKIKAKKFVFYKLIFETNTANTTITLLAADIKVRYTGSAK